VSSRELAQARGRARNVAKAIVPLLPAGTSVRSSTAFFEAEQPVIEVVLIDETSKLSRLRAGGAAVWNRTDAEVAQSLADAHAKSLSA
jgi:hypothetical protein